MNYIDTSAFVKFYSKENAEKGAGKVIQLISDSRQGKQRLISSIFLVGETVSVFDKWVRLRILTGKELDLISNRFFSDIKQLTDNEALLLEPLNSLTIISCSELILKHHITINDAIHLYTAITNRDIIEKFICSDDMLIRAAEKEGFSIFNPEKD